MEDLKVRFEQKKEKIDNWFSNNQNVYESLDDETKKQVDLYANRMLKFEKKGIMTLAMDYARELDDMVESFGSSN